MVRVRAAPSDFANYTGERALRIGSSFIPCWHAMALFSPRHSALSCRTLFWAWPPRVDPHQEHKVGGYALSRLGQEKSIKGPTGSAYLSSIYFLFIFSFRCFFADTSTSPPSIKFITLRPPSHHFASIRSRYARQ